MDRAVRPDQANLELRDYLRVLRRRKTIIVVVTAVLLAAGLGYSLTRPKVFEAESRVLLDSGFSRTILFTDETTIPDVDQQVVTELDLMRSGQVTRLIEERLGYEPDVEIAAVEPSDERIDTRQISVVAASGSAARSATLATDFANAYVEVRRDLIGDDLRTTIEENNTALERLDQDAARSRQQIANLDVVIPTLEGDERLVREAQRQRLQTELDSGSIAQRQLAIQTRSDLLQTALINNDNQSIFKVTDAREPGSPVSPVPLRDGAIALLLGLTLGVAAAFVRDYYDDTVRTKEDLDRISGGVPVLGIIPAVKTWRDKKDAVLELVAHPSSAASEAYRALRTSLEFLGVGRDLKIIHVTSSAPGEGKSTTATNVAVSLARAGKSVILLDCDLRRPRAHEFFKLDNAQGFTSLLLGTATIDQALQKAPDVPGLYVLASGPLPPNPTELLDSELTRGHLRLLATSVDYVIVDSPPLLPVSDSVILARYADATLLVTRARMANRRAIGRSLELLAQVEAPVAGLVLNGAGVEASYGYGYGYGYTSKDPAFTERILTQNRKDPLVSAAPSNGTAAAEGDAEDGADADEPRAVTPSTVGPTASVTIGDDHPTPPDPDATASPSAARDR